MPNLSGGEILIILLVALIVLGPKRLPDAARSVSKGFKELRRVQTSVTNEINATLEEATQPYQPPVRPAGPDVAAAAVVGNGTPDPDQAAGQDGSVDTGGAADQGTAATEAAAASQGTAATEAAAASQGTAATAEAPGPGGAPRSAAVFRPRTEIAGRRDGPSDDWGEAPLFDETS